MYAASLLPHLRTLQVTSVVQHGDALTIEATPRRKTADCPLWQRRARRVHSRYWRAVRDLPCSGVAVVLHLHVRRFVCRNRRCPRQIFCERLPTLTKPHGQLTLRLAHSLQHVGCTLGGEPGSRLAARLGLPASPAALLRLVRQTPLPAVGTVRVLGVDDWARRRGGTYGTLLVDLEQRRPIDLLPERSADELATWLHAHPGVAIVSRDRSPEYAEGTRQGAPEAVQVADRWHLLKNLGDALERLLSRKHVWLREAAMAGSEATGATSAADRPAEAADREPHRVPGAEQDRTIRRARRLERYDAVRRLHAQGLSINAITARVGLARHTVLKYVRAEGFPERAPRRPGAASLWPYAAYLRERWHAGCHNGQQLWRELRAQGYPGSPLTVRRGLACWQAQGALAPSPERASPEPLVRRLSPREATWLLTQPVEALSAADQAHLHGLRMVDAAVEAVYVLAQEFRRLVRERDGKALGPWLHDAEDSGVGELRGFAKHLRRDRAAVEGALTLPWSNGQTEGQITRLKLIKREMYGRAKLDLLRVRVLYRG